MVLGVVVGLILNAINSGSESGPMTAWLVEYIFDVVGRIFIASMKLLVVPLVFVSLVCGSAAMRKNIRMGRIAIKTLGLYLLTTAVAITLALSFANIINPGIGIDTAAVATFSAPVPPAFKDMLISVSHQPDQGDVRWQYAAIIVFPFWWGLPLLRPVRQVRGYCQCSRILTM